MRRNGRARVIAMVAAVAMTSCGEDALSRRQADVADRGAAVMPFDLDATTHVFEPTAAGLLQRVVADDPGDEVQVRLIRGHLEQELARFAAGDYGDPAAIHGEEMPGLAELEANADAVTVTFDEQPDGGRLTFTADRADLIDALHRWGEAQTADHGQHAG